jgi:hypothetical protein
MTAGITALRLEALTDGDLIFGGPGRSPDGLFAVSELEVEVLGADYVKPASEKVTETHVKKLELAQASADFEAPSRLIDKSVRRNDDDKRVFGPSAYLVDGKLETAWSPDRGVGRRNAPSEIVVRFKAPLTLAPGEQLRLRLRFKHSGKDGQGRDTQLLGRFRVALTPAPDATAAAIPTAARLALAVPAATRTADQQAALFAAWRSGNASFAETNAAIAQLWAQYPVEDTTVLVLGERSPDATRATFLLDLSQAHERDVLRAFNLHGRRRGRKDLLVLGGDVRVVARNLPQSRAEKIADLAGIDCHVISMRPF